MFENRYRIKYPDGYLGYEAQIKKWWFPFFWFECYGFNRFCNTHLSLQKAEDFIERHKRHRDQKIYKKIYYIYPQTKTHEAKVISKKSLSF